jgi:hypothetical protein
VSQRGEDSASDAEVDGAHVRAFFSPFEAQGDPAKVSDGHVRISRLKAVV